MLHLVKKYRINHIKYKFITVYCLVKIKINNYYSSQNILKCLINKSILIG